MKKDYSYSFTLTSSVYGYDVVTSFFQRISSGLRNVYITTVTDESKGYESLHEVHSFTIDEAYNQHMEELQKCFNGEYDNYYLEYCEECKGKRFTKESLELFDDEMDNPELLEECPLCKGKGYEVVIRQV